MYGSEKMVRDVLDYVVFEKHLSNEYGIWRIHGKIVPDWLPTPPSVTRTLRKPEFPDVEEETSEKDEKEAVAVAQS